MPALVLYFGVGWEFSEPFEWLFRLIFWSAVIVVIVTAVLTAFGRWGQTRFSRLPLALMVLMLAILLIAGIGSYLVETQADELSNINWSGWLTMALIFGIVGAILFLLKKVLGVIALTLATVFLVMGIGGASLQSDEQETPGRPDGPEDLCLTVDGVNDRETIQTVLPPGYKYVGIPSIGDCATR
ncbi:MAG: hypothetical protein ABIR46_04400 [Candidatus Saccharimonadales bacterium]